MLLLVAEEAIEEAIVARPPTLTVELRDGLATVVRHVAPAEAVIAHSLGAAAVAFAMREGLRVRRLAFIGPPADPLTWVDSFASQLGLRADVTAEMRRLSETRLRMSWDDLPLVPFRGPFDAPALLVVHDEPTVPQRAGRRHPLGRRPLRGGRPVSSGGPTSRAVLLRPTLFRGLVDILPSFVAPLLANFSDVAVPDLSGGVALRDGQTEIPLEVGLDAPDLGDQGHHVGRGIYVELRDFRWKTTESASGLGFMELRRRRPSEQVEEFLATDKYALFHGGGDTPGGTERSRLFLSSSRVEHPAVNRRVVGSNPT